MNIIGKKPHLTVEQRAFIRDIATRKAEALAQFPTRSELAKQFEVSVTTIKNAETNRYNKHHTHEARARLTTNGVIPPC